MSQTSLWKNKTVIAALSLTALFYVYGKVPQNKRLAPLPRQPRPWPVETNANIDPDKLAQLVSFIKTAPGKKHLGLADTDHQYIAYKEYLSSIEFLRALKEAGFEQIGLELDINQQWLFDELQAGRIHKEVFIDCQARFFPNIHHPYMPKEDIERDIAADAKIAINAAQAGLRVICLDLKLGESNYFMTTEDTIELIKGWVDTITKSDQYFLQAEKYKHMAFQSYQLSVHQKFEKRRDQRFNELNEDEKRKALIQIRHQNRFRQWSEADFEKFGNDRLLADKDIASFIEQFNKRTAFCYGALHLFREKNDIDYHLGNTEIIAFYKDEKRKAEVVLQIEKSVAALSKTSKEEGSFQIPLKEFFFE